MDRAGHVSEHPSTKTGATFHPPCYLVAQRLAGNDGDFLTNPLVDVEVVAQAGVVLLDDDPGGLLHGLGPDAPLNTNRTNSWVLTQNEGRTQTTK